MTAKLLNFPVVERIKKLEIMNLFLIRFFLSIAFYVCIPLSSQISVVAGIILVAGYRSLLVLSPYFNKFFGKRDLFFSIILSTIGVIGCFILEQYIIGSLFIAMGLSVGGFILKAIVSETPSTSGLNKVAITSGNIGAGAILFMTNNNIESIAIVLILLICSCFMKMPASNQRTVIEPLSIRILLQNKIPNLVWLFFGMAIGVRVFGMYLIMPNYLLKRLGYIPDWYGLILILYGFIVIFTQLPVISKKISFSLSTALIALIFSCFVMGLPNLFCVETFTGAMVWCFCLAIEELFAPFIDLHAAKTNHLLIKEMSIGIGGALCFLSSQTSLAAEFLGTISIVFIISGYFLYKKAINK